MKIAVIGAGISGNAAAWALGHVHDVTVFEKRARLGGHSATVDVDYDGISIPVDTGFIVYNELNYPNMTALFDHLEVETQASNMSFAVSMDNGRLEWSGVKWNGIFAQRSNLFSPGFLSMLRDILRFNKRAKQDLASGALCGLTINDYLDQRGFSQRLKNDYLIPMTSAIWSTPSRKMLEFPAESMIQFMKNHALIQQERPRWRTVAGGSREYVSKLTKATRAVFRTDSAVARVKRHGNSVEIVCENGHVEEFDQVLFACHSDHALAMIDEPHEREKEILSDVRYTPNDVWLHRDPALMPRRRQAWAAWNYIGSRDEREETEVSVTYWMNRLQNIDENYPLFVTLNPLSEPDPTLTFGRYRYSHPMFDQKAIAAQKSLGEIQGEDRLWFCGAWTGYGFHEDGLASGLKIAEALGGIVPWHQPDASVPSIEMASAAVNEAAE